MSQKKIEIDKTKFAEIREHYEQIKRGYSQRDADFEEYTNMFLVKMRDDIQAKIARLSNTKITLSPDPRNTVLNAVRMMIAQDPIFKVTSKNEMVDTSKIENALSAWWIQSGRIQRRPVHYDNILSAMLYGETITAVTSLADMAKHTNPKHKARAERALKRSPFLIENWNPQYCYSEFDSLGLTAIGRQTSVTWGKIKNDWGAYLSYQQMQHKDSDPCELTMFYDLDYCCYWVDNEPIFLEEHHLPEIPISVTLVDGSRLFAKPEHQRQPMLYTILKSGIWNNQSLALTVLYTMTFGLGANPMFIHTAPQNNPTKKIEPDFSEPGGVIELEPGEQFGPMANKAVIDPSIMEALSLAKNMGQESTMYSQAFGAPIMGRSTTFSEVSLLAQTGRLPLIGPQRLGGEGIAHVAELALMMFKQQGENAVDPIYGLKPSEIPDDLEIEVKLDVKLPQDKLQLANIANVLKSNGLADDEWIQSEILNITDSKGMRQRIWNQDAAKAMFGAYIQGELAKMQEKTKAEIMAMSQPQQPNQPTSVPTSVPSNQQTIDPRMIEAMKRKVMQAGPQMTPNQGAITQGLPAAQAGMMPGAGEGIAPERME